MHPCSIVGQTDSFVYLFWPKSSVGAHQLLVLVCVVTLTESFRVVCGNAHPACFVLRARSFIVEAAQIGKVWRITRRKLRRIDGPHEFRVHQPPQINLDSLKLNEPVVESELSSPRTILRLLLGSSGGYLWHSLPPRVKWGLRLFSNSLWDLEHLCFRVFFWCVHGGEIAIDGYRR